MALPNNNSIKLSQSEINYKIAINTPDSGFQFLYYTLFFSFVMSALILLLYVVSCIVFSLYIHLLFILASGLPWLAILSLIIKKLAADIIKDEVIVFSQTQVTIELRGAFGKKIKTYAYDIATNFRVRKDIDNRQKLLDQPVFKLAKQGLILFDYGLQTIECGYHLEEAAANFILSELHKSGFLPNSLATNA